MANFQQHILQFCVLSLCVLLTTVYGNALKMSSTGVSLDGKKPKGLFEAMQESIGDRPVEYDDDDEDYRDPADERQYYYDPNYKQPLEALIDNKQSQVTLSIDGTKDELLDHNNGSWKDVDYEPGHSLSENNEDSPPVVNGTKFDSKMVRKEPTDTMPEMLDSAGLQRIKSSVNESDGSTNKSVPLANVSTTAQLSKLNYSGWFKTLSDVMKRGIIRNSTGNQTEKIFVNGSGKIEVPLKRGISHLSEMSMTQNHLGFTAVYNVPNKTQPKSAIHNNVIRAELSENSEPESGSAAVQQLGAVTSGDGLKHNKNNSDSELDSNNPSESINSSINNDTSTSVKYGGKYSEISTKVNSTWNSSSQIKSDGNSIPSIGSETTNHFKGGDETRQLEQGTQADTSSLGPQKDGTVSQHRTSKAPSSATATSSKVAAKSQTSKPPPSQSLGDPSSASSSTTTSTTTTHGTTTDQKATSVKSDDSDISIDQPQESNRGGGFNSHQPYQGELVEESLPMVHSTPINDQDSHFFAYFASLLITAALGYVVYHNRNKILALLLEGRRAHGSSGSRRGSSASSIGRRRGRGGGGGAKYLPLHTSLDQVMTSNGTENGGDNGLDRVY